MACGYSIQVSTRLTDDGGTVTDACVIFLESELVSTTVYVGVSVEQSFNSRSSFVIFFGVINVRAIFKTKSNIAHLYK